MSMIRPVQPIGVQPPAPPSCFRPLTAGVRQLCLSSWLVDSPHIPLGLRLQLLALDTATPLAFEAIATPEGPQRSPNPIWPLAMPWQPWKEHAPFATESTRWWPSDELPEIDEPRIVEARGTDVPAPVVDWHAAGGLISAWA